ncbi:hypothetical protein Tco_0687014 [Tanacetum coccineum]
MIPGSEETLALAEESRSKMLLKHKDNMMLEKKKQVDTTPIDYNSINSSEPTLSIRPTNVESKKGPHPQLSLRVRGVLNIQKLVLGSCPLKHSQEEAMVLRDLVDHIKANYPLDPLLESALKQSTSASRSQPSGNTKNDKI